MANANNPFGFLPFKTEGKENRVRYYTKTASAVIYPGDVLKLVAAGTVEVAAAGDTMIGLAADYSAAASTADVAVYDDPDAEFIAQIGPGAFALADVGQCANIVATAGDSALKQSNHSLDSATMDVTATLQFKLLGLLARGENAVGSYAIVRCKPQNHFLGSKPVGI